MASHEGLSKKAGEDKLSSQALAWQYNPSPDDPHHLIAIAPSNPTESNLSTNLDNIDTVERALDIPSALDNTDTIKTYNTEPNPDTTIESAIPRLEQTKQTLKEELNLQTDKEANEVIKAYTTDKAIATIDSAKEDGIITPDEQDSIDTSLSEVALTSEPSHSASDQKTDSGTSLDSNPVGGGITGNYH